MGLERGISLPVVGLVPNAHIVLLQAPPTTRWDGVWSFHVRDSGHGQSRLIVRSRTSRPSGPGRLLAVVMSPWTGLATLVMERGMLLGLQERAERTVAAEAPPPDRRD